MPNGEIFTPTHMARLFKKIPINWNTEITYFPGVNKALLSIGKIYDHGCQAIFDDKTVLILNKGSGKVMLKGKRDPRSNMYMLNLTQRNKLTTEFPTPDKYFAGIVYEYKSKGTFVDYHRPSCWICTQPGWVIAITKNFFTSWPGISYELVQKYLTKNNQPYFGTFKKPRKGLQSTQKKEPQSEPELDTKPGQDQFNPSIHSEYTNFFNSRQWI